MADDDGFHAFVLERGNDLLRTAWMFTGDRHLAEDLLQTALVRTWPHWRRIRDDAPAAYVRTVMARTCAAWWKRRWRGEIPTGELPDSPGYDDGDAAEERLMLRRALAELPPRQRLVLVLRYYEDLSEAQTATVLGCSLGTVKSQTTKAFAKLRISLAPLATGALREAS